MSVVVVCSHLPGEGFFTAPDHPTMPVLCESDDDYWRGLASVWDSDTTIVNVEHDIEATGAHVAELVACPHPLCSWTYELHWASTGLAAATLAQQDEHGQPAGSGARWAARSGLGLVKIAPAARTGVLRREPWHRLDSESVRAAVRGPWHLHRPLVAHHHW